MEGNQCYKLSTVNNYLSMTESPAVKTAIDVGVNIGEVTQLMRRYFPSAKIFGFEAVREYYLQAANRCADDPDIKIFNAAVSGCQYYEDDLGTLRRSKSLPLRVLKGMPSGGPGWVGGSVVVPEHVAIDSRSQDYVLLDDGIAAMSLDEIVTMVLLVTGASEIDYMKMDCEGCEHSAIGCASIDTLRRIRFIGGEYHDIERFYNIMRNKLFSTHYVNLVGDRALGSFFAERIGAKRTILNPDRSGMLIERPWLSARPIEWNVFRNEFVLPEDRLGCAIASHGI